MVCPLVVKPWVCYAAQKLKERKTPQGVSFEGMDLVTDLYQVLHENVACCDNIVVINVKVGRAYAFAILVVYKLDIMANLMKAQMIRRGYQAGTGFELQRVQITRACARTPVHKCPVDH